MNPEPAMHKISLPLDERNLAHVLTALALAGIADGMEDANPASRCWWTEDEFKLLIPATQSALFKAAHDLVQGIRWVEGIGCNEKREIKAAPHHGLFTTARAQLGNPLISFHDQGITSSIFKTFSGQLNPAKLLSKQLAALKPADGHPDWLFQSGQGVAGWKFDCRVSGHAYDQGYSANEEGSGDLTPFYPAIELLSIAGAAFFAGPHVWLTNEDTLSYCVWQHPIFLPLAPLAAAALLDGIDGRHYKLATRGNAYGKGAAYRHFPEANLIS
jgi:hypothetical protein